MKINKKLIFIVTLLLTQFAAMSVSAAIPTKKVVPTFEAKSDFEKLTGVATKFIAKKPADRALQLARESREQKKYILAIKRYNYIIKNFANTKQAAMALMDKSSLYSQMGFAKPASYNFKKAQLASSNQKNNGAVKK